MDWHDVADAAALAPGAIVEVEAGGQALALYGLAGGVRASAAVCPHGAAWLSQGWIDGDCIRCPRHGGAFHIVSGAQRAGPPSPPLRTYPARVIGGRVQVALP